MRDATARQTFGFRVLRAVCLAYAQGEESSIKKLGFTIEEAKMLSLTQLGYLYRISVSTSSFLQVNFRDDITWGVCTHRYGANFDGVLAALWELCVAIADMGCMKTLQKMGLSDTNINFILSIPAGTTSRLLPSPEAVEFVVDHVKLGRLLKHIDGEEAENWAITELMRLGAPHAMLKALFPIPPRSMEMQRRILGFAGKGVNGRPPILDDDQKMLIRQLWGELANQNKAARFIGIAHKTGAAMASIWAVVKSVEFEVQTYQVGQPAPVPIQYQRVREKVSTWEVNDVDRSRSYQASSRCCDHDVRQLAVG